MERIQSILPLKAIRGYLDYNTFNVGHFLYERNCFLKDYQIGKEDAVGIIGNYCRKYKINPQMVLATMEKEFTAIEMVYPPEQNIINKICGVSVAEEDGSMKPECVGFENQVAWCCSTYNFWLNFWHPGDKDIAVLTDGHGHEIGSVVCETPVTLALLKYTPSIEGGLHAAERCFLKYFTV